MSAQPEVWRVSTVEGIFETDLETLKQWIVEGCVLPTDKVSKGSLNWIDAGRAPMLKGAFAGEYTPPPPPPEVPLAEPENQWQAAPPLEDSAAADGWEQQDTYNSQDNFAEAPTACQNHPDAPIYYICRMCAATWCEVCPQFVSGSKIPLCPSCCDLCKLYSDIATQAVRSEYQSSGFGFADFGTAVRYPLRHKTALVCGALLYAFLLLAGFRGAIVAWMIMFGCMSHVISQVAWGRLHRSFMPDFSAFSLWDDLVVPVFLGVGIMIVTWGPIIVLVIALLFGVLQGPGLPGMISGPAVATADAGPRPDDFETLLDPNADPKELAEANKRLNQTRPGAQFVQEAEQSKRTTEAGAALQMLLLFLGAAGFLLVGLFLIGLLWAIFYGPMALTVAGYTESFGAVINPLVGLDTIRRMGSTYFKAFGMIVIVEIVAGIVAVIVAVITSPFNLPFFGNLPANFITGTTTFYFNLVMACLLGLSLHKCADRLGITVD